MEKLALSGKPIYRIPQTNNQFSFSGIKSYILSKKPVKSEYANWASSLFYTIGEIVFQQILIGAKDSYIQYAGISGGVAANSIIRSVIKSRCKNYKIIPVFPLSKLCTDNAEMIAWLAKIQLDENKFINHLDSIKPIADYKEMTEWTSNNFLSLFSED